MTATEDLQTHHYDATQTELTDGIYCAENEAQSTLRAVPACFLRS